MDTSPLCACGCGQPVRWNGPSRGWSTYVDDHYNILQKQRTLPPDETPPLCACGCELPVRWDIKFKRWNKYFGRHVNNPRKLPGPPPNESPPLCGCGCKTPVNWDKKNTRWCQYVGRHYIDAMRISKPPDEEAPLCGCGCGQKVKWEDNLNQWNTFCHGHNRTCRVEATGPAPLCTCGCGQPVKWAWQFQRWNKYIDATHFSKSKAIPIPPPEEAPICTCGCGWQVTWSNNRNRWNTHYPGHGTRSKKNIKEQETPPLCSCGCGQSVKWDNGKNRWNSYIFGHFDLMPFRELAVRNRKPKPQTIVQCSYCGKDIRIHPGLLKKNKDFYCNRNCQHSHRVGVNSSFYRHGLSPLPYGGRTWRKQSRLAKKRDNYTCQYCGKKPKDSRLLHVHHIIPLSNFNGNYKEAHKLTNLLTLCARCHRWAEIGKIAIQPKLL